MVRLLATFALIAWVCIPLAGCQEVEFSEVRKENTDNSVVNSFGMKFESIPAGAFTDLDGQPKARSVSVQEMETTELPRKNYARHRRTFLQRRNHAG